MFSNFTSGDRIFIFQANIFLSKPQQQIMSNFVQEFIHNWKSHNVVVNAEFIELYDVFLIICADHNTLPSGCSIDSLMKMISNLESIINVDFRNRNLIVTRINNVMKHYDYQQLKQDFQHKVIDQNTIIFDNTMTTKNDFILYWQKDLEAYFA